MGPRRPLELSVSEIGVVFQRRSSRGNERGRQFDVWGQNRPKNKLNFLSPDFAGPVNVLKEAIAAGQLAGLEEAELVNAKQRLQQAANHVEPCWVRRCTSDDLLLDLFF